MLTFSFPFLMIILLIGNYTYAAKEDLESSERYTASDITGNITLYARWDKKLKVTLNYDGVDTSVDSTTGIPNNEYYYVYGEEGNNWLLFKLYSDFNEEYDELSISSKVFYTDYKNNIKKAAHGF